MQFYDFSRQLRELWDQSCHKYEAGNRDPDACFDPAQLSFLRSHGLGVMDIYDYVEDFVSGGDPDFGTFLLIAAVRRDYFHHVQKAAPSGAVLDVNRLPAKDASVEGITWLPRILPKARAKLAGELPPDLMYGCGGDRRFLREHDIEPSEFLRVVWASDGDDAKVIAFVKERSRAKA